MMDESINGQKMWFIKWRIKISLEKIQGLKLFLSLKNKAGVYHFFELYLYVVTKRLVLYFDTCCAGWFSLFDLKYFILWYVQNKTKKIISNYSWMFIYYIKNHTYQKVLKKIIT